MLTRNNLLDLFSTFIQFSEDRMSKWITDLKLQKSINCYLKQESKNKITENFVSLFLYRQWCDNPSTLAKYHLIAYLQEPCYWASQNIISKFPN